MADSQIKMILSLVDNASPGVEAFIQKLKGLESALNSSAASFKTFQANATSVKDGAGSATSAIAGLEAAIRSANSSLTGVGTRLNNMGEKAESAASGLKSASAAMMAAQGAASGLSGQVGLANNALGGTARDMNRAAGAALNFEGRLASLGKTIKGLGELWAAAKVGHGLEESGKEAMALEDTRIRARNAGGKELEEALKTTARSANKRLPQFDENEMSKIGLDIYGATGHVEDLEKLDKLAKALYVMKKSDATGKFNDRSSQAFFKALEDFGSFQDNGKLEADTQAMVKAAIQTQGRVGAQQWQMFAHTLRGGMATAMETETKIQMVPFIEAYGASTAATILNAMNRTISGSQIKKELIPNWQKLNLADDKGNIKNYDQFRKNQIKWYNDNVLPAAEKSGVDRHDETQMTKVNTKLFGQQNAIEGGIAISNRVEQFEKQVAAIKKAADAEQAYQEIIKTTSASLDTAKSALVGVGQAIGEQLLPMVKEGLDLFTSMATSLKEAIDENAIVGKIAGIGAALTAMGLAIMGAASVFSFLMPAALLAGEGVIAALLPIVARMGVLAVAAVAAFTAGFVFWESIKNFQAFGSTLDNLATQTVTGLISTFDRLVVYLSNVFMAKISSVLNFASAAADNLGLKTISGELKGMAGGIQNDNAARNQGLMQREGIRNWMDSEANQKANAEINKQQNMAADAKQKELADLWNGPKQGASHGSGKPAPAWLNEPNGKGAGGGRGRSPGKDPEAAAAEQAARVEREKLATHLHDIETLYKDHKIGVEELYAAKTESIVKGTADEISALERERAALAKDPKRNAGQLAKIEADIEIAKMKEKSKLLDLEREKTKELQKLKDDGLKMEADIESITQSGTKKRIALLEEEYRKKIEIFKVNGMLKEAAEQEKLKQIAIGRAQFDFESQQLDRKRGDQKLGEQSVHNQLTAGGLTSLEAAQKTNDLRMQEGQIIDSLVAKLEEYAKVSQDPKLIDRVKQLRLEAAGLKFQFDEVTKTVRGGLTSGIEGALEALTTGKGWKAALKALEKGILDPINKMMNKSISEALTNAMFGKADGTGGGDGPFGKIAQQLFGMGSASGGVSANATGKGSSGAQVANDALTKLATDGANVSTQSLIENATKSSLGATVQEMATTALQGLAQAAQGAAMALQSMGGGGGGLGSLLGGGADPFGGFSLDSLPSYAVGAGDLASDMIAKVHKGEMIIPARTAERVRARMENGGSLGGGGGGLSVTNHFTLQGNPSRDTQAQIANKVGSALQSGMRRSGG